LVIRTTTRFLRDASARLVKETEGIAAASKDLAAASQELTRVAFQQAASLKEVSASTGEINSIAGKNGEISRSAVELVTQSQGKFDGASLLLEDMVLAISEISTESTKISRIIKVIDEIAFQTNILALNAAVEAARAGEAGLGFAVVAEEVRNLAQRSATAARDTAELVAGSISRSASGQTKVEQVAKAIRILVEESTRTRALVEEVNVGSQAQMMGVDQVARTISQLEEAIRSNASRAEQSASSTKSLNAQSEALREIAGQVSAIVGIA
jgi:methyl-accepting chemotaxis protein